jgi:HEAT repeat protein
MFTAAIACGYLLARLTAPAPASADMLLAAFSSDSASDRLGAVHAADAVDVSSDAVRLALIRTLETDPSVTVRVAAVDALSRDLDRPDVARSVLLAALIDESPNVQYAAVRAAARKKPDSARPVVEQLLAESDLDPTLRSHVESLARTLEDTSL